MHSPGLVLLAAKGQVSLLGVSADHRDSAMTVRLLLIPVGISHHAKPLGAECIPCASIWKRRIMLANMQLLTAGVACSQTGLYRLCTEEDLDASAGHRF